MVIGQYRIIEKIGQGGMGVIYKAEHTTLEQIVAIKALPSSFGSSTDICERFLREAKIQAKLSHPNVVNILNFLEHEGNNYIVMEYVDGETLESIIRTTGLIPPERCVTILRQVLDGIGYAHSQGVIHRDIKPSNIMITRQGTVKITDFGIAKITGDLKHTQTGVKVGTLWYMSPEQVQGQPAGITTDIYALGITLFEMVTGKVPFTGDSEYHIMNNIVQNPPPDPREFYPYIPLSLEKTILKAISKSPADRFQNVGEFARSLEQEDVNVAVERGTNGACQAAVPVQVTSDKKPASRKLFLAITGTAVAAVAAAASVAIVLHTGSGEKSRAVREVSAPLQPARVEPTRVIEQAPAGTPPAQQEPQRREENTERNVAPSESDVSEHKGDLPRKQITGNQGVRPRKQIVIRYQEQRERPQRQRGTQHGSETLKPAQDIAEEAARDSRIRNHGNKVPNGSFTKDITPN